MKRPRATYRLQFRNGMTFDRAVALVPYLARLGVSHLYASPLFEAVSDSTHGYDVADLTLIDSALGGADGLRTLTDALQKHGLGLILDFVPNHMAASPQNPWWSDVLEWGAASTYAHHFDINWSTPKLIVPVLGAGYGETLRRGGFGLVFDGKNGGISLTYGGLALPLTPPSYAHILSRIDREGFAEQARRFALAKPEDTARLKAQLAGAASDVGIMRAIEHVLTDITSEPDELHRLHEAQVWRLVNWRAARESLTYRRFFEIADYVGLRVESQRVFDDVHARLLELVADGSIAGIRLDHVDGLADPQSYLDRLKTALGKQQFYLVVEKILEGEEEMRREWPVAGTTGYEFITSLSGLLVSHVGEPEMTRGYNAFVGREVAYAELVVDTKRRILARNFAGELEQLKSMASRLAGRHATTRDLGPDTLRDAIIELMTALPVYRTYVGVAGPGPQDRALLEGAAARAKATREVEDEAAIDFVRQALELRFEEPKDQGLAFEFTVRFQQTSGPVMAKAIEDTAFFRYNRLIALNEVGGSPDHFGADADEFHKRMAARAVRQSGGLSATATHDTKLGEDARARLYVLSEDPQTWAEAVNRWAQRNAEFARDVRGTRVPEPEIEWLFYQALAAIWPPNGAAHDAECAREISDRMSQYMRKAAREAKVHTSWTAPNEDYENAIETFLRGALDPARAGGFLQDFVRTCGPVMLAGAANLCTQTLIKIAAPGVPDIYQGAELWDLALVDPDNRRPVDFEQRSRFLDESDNLAPDELLTDWRSGRLKMHILRAGLRLRAEMPVVFSEGGYTPLVANGELASHVVGFSRNFDMASVVALAPRLALKLLHDCTTPMVPPGRWGDTCIALPRELSGRDWRNVFTGEIIPAADSLALSLAFRTFPVALLASPGR